jgi:hypothetical protein
VRALSRSATAIRLHDPKLGKLEGDALDRDTIERALVGVDAVIQTLGVSPAPELIFSGTRGIIEQSATAAAVAGSEASDANQAPDCTRLHCIDGDSRRSGKQARSAYSSGVSMPTKTCRSVSSAGAGSTGRLFVRPS